MQRSVPAPAALRVVVLAAVALAVGQLGCARTVNLAEIEIVDAVLSDVAFTGMVVAGGGRVGNGTLELEEPDGTPHFIDVRLGGPVTGFAMDMSLVSVAEERAVIDISAIDTPHGDDVLGPYEGFVAEGGMLLGAQYHDLRNDRGAQVELGGVGLDVGISMLVGHEWLTIDVAPEGEPDPVPDLAGREGEGEGEGEGAGDGEGE